MTKSEQKYLQDHLLDSPPVCRCGKPLKFRGSVRGYAKYCCAACANSDPDKIKRTVDNIQKKYGVTNISQLESVKEKKKGKCYHGHGKPWTDETRIKFTNSMLERYGVTHPSQMEDYLDKRKETWLKKYGVEHPSQLESIKIQKIKKRDDATMHSHPEIINITREDGMVYYHVLCDVHGDVELPSRVFYDRNRYSATLCPKCNPIGNCSNTAIEKFVEDFLIENNISYIKHDRSVLDGKELDFYIPSHKLAIECNGVYWHSMKGSKYHFNKYKKCLSANIQLLTLWEDWFVHKPDIIKHLLSIKLNLVKNKIFARNCTVKEISQKDADNILQYHFQGSAKSPIRLGLFYNDHLVSVMTFGKYRSSILGSKQEDTFELVRHCSVPDIIIVGGTSKLFKHFIRQYNPTKVVSFSSNDISTGAIYNILGFEKVRETYGNYWYIENNTYRRLHRYNFRKSKLVEMGYDVNKSESEIMKDLPYFKIYDSGTTTWVYKIKEEL